MCSNPRTPWLVRADDNERICYWFRADCKLWTCEECGQKRKARVAARAARGAEYFERIGYPVQFTTLTMHRKVRTKNASIKRWRECWPRLRKRVSRRIPEFHYGLFPEQHKNGAVHFHLLETSGFTEREFKDHCTAIGLGYILEVEKMESAAKVASYVTKYMAKAIGATNWPKGYHRYRFSCQWPNDTAMESATVVWRVFLSMAAFDDELRHWHRSGYRIVNTRTGEINNG